MSNHILMVLLALLVECTCQQTSSFECGEVKVKTVDTIIRGHETSAGSWPWHAAISHRDHSNTKYECGGTLISSLFVLTSAHCVIDNNGHKMSPKRILVTLGMHDRHSTDTTRTQNHNVQEIYLYQHNKSTDRNDISLVELSTSVKFTDYIQPACLNKNNNLTGQIGTVAGWGLTESDELSTVLRVLKLPVIGSLDCISADRRFHAHMLDKSLFCAGYMESRAVCNGDSGGGLMFKNGDRWFVGGIVSYTGAREGPKTTITLCRENGYAGFTNVHQFLPWIQEITHVPLLNETQIGVDECGKSNSLCVGSCENTLGSYVCRCPQGYMLGHDGRSCIDINECESKDVCNGRNKICTNIRGNFRCTHIDCPYDYEIDPVDKSICRRTDRHKCFSGDLKCLLKPEYYSYNFKPLVSNETVPPAGRALFNIRREPAAYEVIDFDLKMISTDAQPNVRPADESFFRLDKLSNKVQLILVKSIEGPQNIELALNTTVFMNGQPYVSYITKFFLMIAANEF